jgi:hypothetical protein
MHHGRPASRFLRAEGLCKVTVLVPEDCAEGVRQFAYELRARYGAAPAQFPQEWRTLSPNVELMVDPERRARCGIRDTRAPGRDRFLWSVTLLGQFRTIATGRTAERTEARTLAEAALNAYAADWRELWGEDSNND